MESNTFSSDGRKFRNSMVSSLQNRSMHVQQRNQYLRQSDAHSLQNDLKNQIQLAKEQYNYGHFVIQCLYINRLDQINFKMVSTLFRSQDPEDDGTIKEDFLPTLKLLMKYYQSKMLSDASHCQVLQPSLSSASKRISLANIRASRDSTLVDGLFTPSS